MPHPTYATLDDGIAHTTILFSLDSPETFDAAVDALVTAAAPGLKYPRCPPVFNRKQVRGPGVNSRHRKGI